ncbi:MAG: hypothetical protein WD750_06640 [Gammaproteobacteria bacterium]
MKKINQKLSFLAGGFVGLIVVALIVYRAGIPGDGSLVPSLLDDSESHWTWKNPVTSGETSIQSGWKQTENTVYEGALLTITHKSGKSLVYISHEKVSGDMSLYDYVAGVEDSMQDQLGIGQFEAVDEEYRFYEAEGAELFGKVVAETRVSIWRSGGDNFWEAVTITDQDYKDLEYEAVDIVNLLMGTTY